MLVAHGGAVGSFAQGNRGAVGVSAGRLGNYRMQVGRVVDVGSLVFGLPLAFKLKAFDHRRTARFDFLFWSDSLKSFVNF